MAKPNFLKSGNERYLLPDMSGAPLPLIVTAANRPDVSQLEAVFSALIRKYPAPPCRSHKHLRADASYSEYNLNEIEGLNDKGGVVANAVVAVVKNGKVRGLNLRALGAAK